MNERKNNSAWVVALGLLIAAYLSGYFVLGTQQDWSWSYGTLTTRGFASPLLCHAYYPLGWGECRIRQKRIVLFYGGDGSSTGQSAVDHRFEP